VILLAVVVLVALIVASAALYRILRLERKVLALGRWSVTALGGESGHAVLGVDGVIRRRMPSLDDSEGSGDL
jgi:hypothetical protein